MTEFILYFNLIFYHAILKIAIMNMNAKYIEEWHRM